MATKKMLTIPGQDLVLPTQLPGDVTPKRMIGNPTFTPDGKQITGGSGVTYSLKDMGGQDTPYTTTEVVGVKGGPAPSSESLDSILASNRQAIQRASTPNVSNVSGNKNTVIPNTKLLAQAGGQSDSLPGAISPEDRIPGVYYPTPLPTPNTPTPTNPVTKNSLQKAVPIAPDMAQIQQMDINNLNDTIDKLQIKQSKEQLSDEELLTLRRATRQLQQSMTPQSLTGGLDEMIAKKETNITETTNKLDKQNEQELAQFKQSQEVYKQAELQAIEQADEEQKKTLGYILGAQGAGTSSYGAEQINKITQNSLQKKQYLTQAIQAKIDLYGSQLRKDSQETIQTLQTNLDNLYMKAAESDVENIKELNAFNKEQGANKIKEIDDMIAFAQQQQKLALPLTEAEKQQAQAFAGNIYDNEGNFDDKTFELLQKINPKLAMEAVLQGGSIQKERMSNDLAMKGLDADIKRAQLNKLLNPAKEYEYIKDADGNTIAVAKDNPNERINITGGGEGLGDMRNLASQFPGQARAKNNNPAGITWNANFDNPKPGTTAYALQQAGVNFEKGTPRPGNEGGNYVTFPTMEDGLAAQRIMMTQTYGNTTVGNMLAKWVGTGEGPRYAQQVAGMAGVDINATVNQLSDQQLQTLQMAKIQKESPGLAKILQQQSTEQAPSEGNFPQYASYIENGKLPVGMKDGTSKAETFKKQALEGYVTGKEQELNGLGLTIANPQAFASTASNAPKMKAINEALAVVPAFTNTMDQLIELTDKYGTELIPGNAKNQMNMLVKDAQLQAKEIYNLGVLNGPDLSLMEAIISNPADWTAKGQQLFGVSFKKSLENAKAKIMDNAIEKAKSIGLAPIGNITQKTGNSDPLGLGI